VPACILARNRPSDRILALAAKLLNTGGTMTAIPSPYPTAPARRRSLLPHEHGAWGQLGMPLAAALAIGRPNAPALLLTAAIVLAFVAHEPLLVALGQRGFRAAQEDGPRARRWLAVLAALAAASGAAGVALAPAVARAALAIPAALTVVVAVLVWRRREKTIAGEIAVAAALASAASAVALAGGAPVRSAAAALAAWVLGFSAATLAVQVILVRVRSKGGNDPGKRHAAGAALLLAAGFALAAIGMPPAVGWATAPTAVVSVIVCLGRFSPKRLRELGWALVASSAATLIILVAGLR
jgi:hypothetical protein